MIRIGVYESYVSCITMVVDTGHGGLVSCSLDVDEALIGRLLMQYQLDVHSPSGYIVVSWSL